MFTGIIEEIGQIINITDNKIVISCSKVLIDTKTGDSISVNGVCLTASEIGSNYFSADISKETINVTAFREIKNKTFVNLERAMPANGRFGGHIVSGHIDGVGQIVELSKDNNFYNLKIRLSETLLKYCIKKGSVTIDGISLTIAKIEKDIIKIAIIPHTFENTNLKFLKNNSFVNIENDIFAKYIEKFLSTSDNRSRIDLSFLQQNGFA